MNVSLANIVEIIETAALQAAADTGNEPEPDIIMPAEWPVTCTVGPGLEGAIACETKVGYVNGAKGWLVYRGYDIFDLCAHATYEEVSYLLIHGKLPTAQQLADLRRRLAKYRFVNATMRTLMGFPVEKMNPMAALRLGINLMRLELSKIDLDSSRDEPFVDDYISMDEDTIPMEKPPKGERHAVYEFSRSSQVHQMRLGDDVGGLEACYHLIAGIPTLAAALSRVREGRMPIEPDPQLSLAANFLYMLTGDRPTALEEKVMDVCMILHADHGMNASTFAAMVVASTLSDVYFSIGAGVSALNGPLHGGANEQVVKMLEEIRTHGDVSGWLDRKLAAKEKIMGFGHRVYKTYDPRARVLAPLAEILSQHHAGGRSLLEIAQELEKEMIARLGRSKGIFPNVDLYSGIVYASLGIPSHIFTSVFAIGRVSGWAARVLEYLENNRIFRPRSMYVGEFGKRYTSLECRNG